MDFSKFHLTRTTKLLEFNSLVKNNTPQALAKQLVEQRKLLYTVSQVSKKLLSVGCGSAFDDAVRDCLALLSQSTGKGNLFVLKNFTDSDGKEYCIDFYHWPPTTAEEDKNLPRLYYEANPSLHAMSRCNKCVNTLLPSLSEDEQQFLETLNVKALLMFPLVVGKKHWGFIGIHNCHEAILFSSAEEDMLLTSGSLLANTIEKMETEIALRQAEERTQLMLDAMPLCCNLWTSEGENIRCNDEAVRLFDLSSQEEYLQQFFRLSPRYQPCGTPSAKLAQEHIKYAFENGGCKFEWMHQKFDGTPIPSEVSLVRVKNKGGDIVAGYTRDLREQKAMLDEIKTKEALRIARDQALMNSRAKSNFLANMSHEIRTPMNAISGFSDIILRDNPIGNTAKNAKRIKDASASLINIINDILDISKIESGKLELYNAQYSVETLLNDVVNISRMRLANKPLIFITDIDSSLPAQLVGDENRTKQILLNLLSNAIKYTNEGHFSLKITSTVTDNVVALRFIVSDSGVGIKQKDLGGLFEEFERVNTTKNRSVEGTGLGLTISKQLCKMMGGDITVTSTYGKGSEFVATVFQQCPTYAPIVQVDEPKTVLLYESRELCLSCIEKAFKTLNCTCICCQNQSELYENIDLFPYYYIFTSSLHLKKVQTVLRQKKLTTPVAAFLDQGEVMEDERIFAIPFPVNCISLAPLLNGKVQNNYNSQSSKAALCFVAPTAKVLLVDDNLVNLLVAQGLMEPYRFEIDTATNGVDALEMIINKEYDLVFMDHMMPRMDGVDTTIEIRAQKEPYYKNLPIIALTANAIVGTREMFIREGMNDFLAKPIDIDKLAHALLRWLPKDKVLMVSPDEFLQKQADTKTLYIEGVDTAKGIQRVGGSFENYLTILATYHFDGRQKCLSLLRHIANNDLSAFCTEVHALKSTSATIGALEVSKMAQNLEAAAKDNDILLIKSDIHDFIFILEEVLNAILPVLPQAAPLCPTADGKPIGDEAYLQAAKAPLADALELAHTKGAEEILGDLLSFAWQDDISLILLAMQEHLNMFDYDSALECLEKLK